MTAIFSKTAPKWADEHNDDGEGVVHVRNIDWPEATDKAIGESLFVMQTVSYQVHEDGTFVVDEGQVTVNFGNYEFETPAQLRAALSALSYAAALQEAIQKGRYDTYADEPPAEAA